MASGKRKLNGVCGEIANHAQRQPWGYLGMKDAQESLKRLQSNLRRLQEESVIYHERLAAGKVRLIPERRDPSREQLAKHKE